MFLLTGEITSSYNIYSSSCVCKKIEALNEINFFWLLSNLLTLLAGKYVLPPTVILEAGLFPCMIWRI